LQLIERCGICVPSSGGSAGRAGVVGIDSFRTHNDFYGGQLGVKGEWEMGRAFVNVAGKVALGDSHEQVNVVGLSTVTPPGGPTRVAAGGLLALPTNIGTVRRDAFAVVPEGAINVGYRITDHVRAFVGYTFLYYSDVARPGDQIPTSLNGTQVPTNSQTLGRLIGAPIPQPSLRSSDFWAQGLNFGVEFRF
jgi:hypothetical protein